MKYLLKVFVLLLMIGVCSCAEDIEFPIDEDPLDKYVGTWGVSDNALKLNYEVSIVKSSSNSSAIILNNFAGSGDAAVGLVAGKSVVISYQEVGQSWHVNGAGTYISSSQIFFNYTLDIGGSQEDRNAVFIK
jgi:hypothetical protein